MPLSVVAVTRLSGVLPRSSLADGSAPSSSSSATICGRFLSTARCSGVRCCSKRLIFAATSERSRLDKLPHQVGAVERDGREDGRLGAARQQKVGNIGPHLLEAGGPADHADLVLVALPVDVGAGRQQPLHDREMPALRGPVQGRGVVQAVAQVDAEPALQQQLDAGEMAALGGQMQQRPVPRATGDAQLGRMLSRNAASSSALPAAAAAMICPSRLDASTCAFSARQLLKPYSSATACWAWCSLAPASSARSSASRCLAAFFSHSRSGRGGRDLTMAHLLSRWPGVRSSRARKKMDGGDRASRWVQPFTRTVGRLIDQAQKYRRCCRCQPIGCPRRAVDRRGPRTRRRAGRSPCPAVLG